MSTCDLQHLSIAVHLIAPPSPLPPPCPHHLTLPTPHLPSPHLNPLLTPHLNPPLPTSLPPLLHLTRRRKLRNKQKL